MNWAKLKFKARINLCRSGVENFSMLDLDINWSELDITGDNPCGYPPLIQKIASLYGAELDQVATTQGTSQALFLTCAALICPGDTVLVESPAYEPLLAVPEALGGHIKRFARKFENGYQLSWPDFDAAISEGARLVVLSNLHNPSGTWLPPESISALAKKAGEKGASLLIDEIYLEFLCREKSQSAFGLADNVIVISSLTKAYGLGGLRSGWVLGPKEVVKKIKEIVNYINVEGVFLSEQLSLHLFNLLPDIKKRNSEQIAKNLSLVSEFIDVEGRLAWVRPAGGVVCFPRLQEPHAGDRLAEVLRSKFDTCVVPGRFFESSRHFRLSYGIDTDILIQGLDNIRSALKKLR